MSPAQTLFEWSEEAPGLEGLGIIVGTVTLFDATKVYRCRALQTKAPTRAAPLHTLLQA